MTRNEDGPGVAHPEPAEKITTATKQPDHRQRSAAEVVPVVFGTLLIAVAGALCDRILVRACCWCGHAHLHYVPTGGDTSALERAPRCRPNRRYQIRVTNVLPAIVPVAGTRRRWTA